jgi:hypothetical protein
MQCDVPPKGSNTLSRAGLRGRLCSRHPISFADSRAAARFLTNLCSDAKLEEDYGDQSRPY